VRKAVVVGLLVALVFPVAGMGSASQYDRKPVRLRGLVPDNWGLSISRGQTKVRRDLYPNAYRAYCVGVIMIGFAEDSSFLHGGTRYWDKLLCYVVPTANATRGTAFILDAKRNRSIQYRKTTFEL
jgi:hypothetical protein